MRVTKEARDFWKGFHPEELVNTYGSPLYVYREDILRQRCRDLKNMVTYPNFVIDYSIKANSNPHLLKIVREEGVEVDTMSPGEIRFAQMAGFQGKEIFYICNNVSYEEMAFAVENGVKISVDSLAQLETFGTHFPGQEVAIRVNPGIGAGHHQKVVTAGKETKFGIDAERVGEIKGVLKKFDLKLIGINQHIGSLFLKAEEYLKSIDSLLEFAREFEGLTFVDFGGGFGIPYHKKAEDARLDIQKLGAALDEIMFRFSKEYDPNLCFRIEPGRYISAECGAILGRVHCIKDNHGKKYVGCDIGFNVLMRPILYDSYHELDVYRKDNFVEGSNEEVTVVGNICESGDILAKERMLPAMEINDLLMVSDAGAYGHVMTSNYNGRLRPAEILLKDEQKVQLIRKRDTLEDLLKCYEI